MFFRKDFLGYRAVGKFVEYKFGENVIFIERGIKVYNVWWLF